MKMLIVDDNQFAVEQIVSYVKMNNMDVDIHEAYNGQRAIEKVNHNKYDLILLDISMPDISGIEVLKHVRKIDKNVKVVVVSVWALEYQTEELAKEGIDDFLAKPVEMDQILEWINKVKKS